MSQTAYQNGLNDHLYYQKSVESAIKKETQKYNDVHYVPNNFRQAFAQYHQQQGTPNSISLPAYTPLRQVRNGKMPSNFYAPPSVLKSWGLDPSNQEYIVPTRRKRWHNAPGDFNRYSEQFYEKIFTPSNYTYEDKKTIALIAFAVNNLNQKNYKACFLNLEI